MKNTHKIASAIRNNDLTSYQQARYPEIQDGEVLRFVDEDFSSVDFANFAMGFFKFDNCCLDDALHIYGQPIIFNESSVRRVNFYDVSTIMYALNSDFRDIKLNHNTRFAYGTGDLLAKSIFIGCSFDHKTREQLAKQGVEFIDI